MTRVHNEPQERPSICHTEGGLGEDRSFSGAEESEKVNCSCCFTVWVQRLSGSPVHKQGSTHSALAFHLTTERYYVRDVIQQSQLAYKPQRRSSTGEHRCWILTADCKLCPWTRIKHEAAFLRRLAEAVKSMQSDDPPYLSASWLCGCSARVVCPASWRTR